MYEFLLRYVVSNDTDAKTAKKYIDQSFVVRLLELFDRCAALWGSGSSPCAACGPPNSLSQLSRRPGCGGMPSAEGSSVVKSTRYDTKSYPVMRCSWAHWQVTCPTSWMCIMSACEAVGTA